MLKIVPDPPLHDKYTTHTLEDLLVQISEYLVCALTVSQQTVLLHAKPPGQVLTLAAPCTKSTAPAPWWKWR